MAEGLSNPCRIVHVSLNLCHVNFELHNLMLHKGEHKTDEFLRLNVRCKVPVLKDGDFELTESFAILEYLGREECKKLVPSDRKVNARMHEAIQLCRDLIWGPAGGLGYHLSFKPLFSTSVDHARVEELQKGAADTLPMLEEKYFQDNSEFVLGKDVGLTYADVVMYVCLHHFEKHGVADIQGNKFPRLRNFLDSMNARPEVQEVNKPMHETCKSCSEARAKAQ
eukprot:Clim_evm12s54 gene=Clim_evmTU12s54